MAGGSDRDRRDAVLGDFDGETREDPAIRVRASQDRQDRSTQALDTGEVQAVRDVHRSLHDHFGAPSQAARKAGPSMNEEAVVELDQNDLVEEVPPAEWDTGQGHRFLTDLEIATLVFATAVGALVVVAAYWFGGSDYYELFFGR